MVPLKKLSFLALPLLVWLASLGGPARAQQSSSPRFAFADTTLLRDTLNLKFDLLFPLADSLQMLPDTLRALAIRYRLPLSRMVLLADSLRVPVDSVGPIMDRERYNPLAAHSGRSTVFGYNSGYNVDRRSSTWGNDVTYNLVLGSLFVRNQTSLSITRTEDVDLTDIHQGRSSTTELGWKLNRNLSVGGRVSLQGTDNFKPGSIYNNSQTTNEYNFSMRSRLQPTKKLTSDFNLYGGPFDEPNSIPLKRGFGSTLSGRVSYLPGRWLTQDLDVQVSGRYGRAQIPERPWLGTHDLSRDFRANLAFFPGSRASLRVSARNRHSVLQRPDTLTQVIGGEPIVADRVRTQPTSDNSIDGSLRLQYRPDTYLNVNAATGRQVNIIAVTRDGVFTQDQSLSLSGSFGLDGRATLRGWSFEGRFNKGRPTNEQPRRSVVNGVTVYYRERQEVDGNSVSGRATRLLTRRITLNVDGDVSLNSTFVTANGATNHTVDDYRQSYRIETQIVLSQKATTTLRLQVGRSLNVNLLAASSASNREERNYRSEWQWSYRLLPGLTANQFNQLAANYIYYSFAPERNRLGLEYVNTTTLNAIVTPRLTIGLTHSARIAPSGDYTKAADGQDYFSRSDEGRDYGLHGSIIYQPVAAISLHLDPIYAANDREGTVNGLAVPVSRQRTLNFAGGASLNFPVGAKGQLTGNIARIFADSRSTSFSSGLPKDEPRVTSDYWNGSLQFSWQL